VTKGKHLATPNRIVQNYFEALRRLTKRTKGMEDNDERKQDIALCLVLSVTAVEAFVNVYFRVVVSESGFQMHLPQLEKDLANYLPLSKKLKQWPEMMFGKGVEMGNATGKAFKALVAHRNDLIHFKSSHETISVPGVSIHGMADISVFDSLVPSDAENALDVAEGVLAHIFVLRGIAEDQVPNMLHGWTGKFPVLKSSKIDPEGGT
jgi:hypothetical protein